MTEEDVRLIGDLLFVVVKIRNAVEAEEGVTLTFAELRTFLDGIKLAIS